ncbi:MAG: signal recognition particle-docking protein FtsY [Deltaproteobacteria bacterium]|nr:signal recognition particle-docking protein FtsY [Deltaproteobacteria bacterium]
MTPELIGLVVVLVIVAIVVIAVVVRRRPGGGELPAEGGKPQLKPGGEEKARPKPGPAPAAEEHRERETVKKAEARPKGEREAGEARKAEEKKRAEEEKRERAAAEARRAEEEKRAEEARRAEETRRAEERKAGAEEKRKRVAAVRKGLEATRGGLVAKLSRLFRGKKEISAELLSSIEEALITSDVGARTTDRLVGRVREGLSGKDLSDEGMVWEFLREEARAILSVPSEQPEMKKGEPYVILVLGVNGVGKTTTIGKLASRYKAEGREVVLAAADTFRAAAVQQLQIWGRRVPCEVVSGKEGADPSSVAFSAIEKAKAVGADVVIVDTAGRLHTKVPLMEELKKIARVLGKAQEGAPHEVLLVLDANTGQNANQQATTFREAAKVTGIALTKLDGTAKGGVILGICDEQKIPVRYIGIGEGIDDLRPFDPELFVSALFDDVGDVSAAA